MVGFSLHEKLGRQFLGERERWILWTPVAFGTGIALYFALTREPQIWLGPSVTVCSVITLVLLRRFPVAVIALSALISASLGFSVVKWRSDTVAAPVLEKPTRPVSVSGLVVGVESFPDRPRVQLADIDIRGRRPPKTIPDRILLRLHPDTRVDVGDRISVLARLLPPPGPVTPGAFDYQRRVWFQSIGATGFALGEARVLPGVVTDDALLRMSLAIGRLRQDIAKRIRAVLPGPEGALAVALIVGDRSVVPESATQSLRDSGLAHLLAISGLHIGLVASIFFFCLRALFAAFEPLVLRFDIKKIAASAALCASFAYLLISGTTVPTQRAFLMGGLVLCAMLLDRKAISLRMVAVAALVIMAISPESIVSASFQMSFAAVTALVATYEALEDRIRLFRQRAGFLRRVGFYFAMLLLTTLVAGIATGIIAAFHFGRITHYGLIANLVAIPLTAFWIMPSAVLGCLLMPVGLDGIGLQAMGAGIRILVGLAGEIASWPGAVGVVAMLPTTSFAIVVFGGLWLCLMSGHWRWMGIGAMAVGALFAQLVTQPDVLISDSGKLIAIRTADGRLSLSQLRSERFTAERWLQRNGQLRATTWNDLSNDGFGIRCDRLGCVYEREGHTISFLRDATALDEDCRYASVVVSTDWHRRKCGGRARLITAREFRKEGAHAIYIESGGLRIVTANSIRGNRPWVPNRDRY